MQQFTTFPQVSSESMEADETVDVNWPKTDPVNLGAMSWTLTVMPLKWNAQKPIAADMQNSAAE